MNYTNIPAEYPVKADLRTDPRLSIRGSVPEDLSREALEYAALRFLARCPRLFRRYAAESCRLRFSQGKKGGKARRFRCAAPASLMELPGGWVELTLRVDREAITVTGMALLDRKPRPRTQPQAPAPDSIRVWRPEEETPGKGTPK